MVLLDRNISAIAGCAITRPVLSERRSFEPFFRSSLKKIGQSVSVYQLLKVRLDLLGGTLDLLGERLPTRSSYSPFVKKPRMARSRLRKRLLRMALCYWKPFVRSFAQVLSFHVPAAGRCCLLLKVATRAMVQKFKASGVPNLSKNEQT